MTANESLELLGTLERGPLRRIGGFSGRQVRYLATQGVLSASGRESAGQGDTRLYTADDVALQRLYVRLKAAGMPPWQIRGIFVYLGPPLRLALQRGQDRVLVVNGGRGSLLTAREALRAPGDVRVPLRSLRQGVPAAVRHLRAQQPTVWAGWRRQSVREALTR